MLLCTHLGHALKWLDAVNCVVLGCSLLGCVMPQCAMPCDVEELLMLFPGLCSLLRHADLCLFVAVLCCAVLRCAGTGCDCVILRAQGALARQSALKLCLQELTQQCRP